MLFCILILAVFVASIKSSTVDPKHYECGDVIQSIDDYVFISSIDFPNILNDSYSRNKCVFSFNTPGTYSLIFTNANLTDLVIVQDGVETYFKNLSTVNYKSAFHGNTIGFYLRPNVTLVSHLGFTFWQAFQAVIYNVSTNNQPVDPNSVQFDVNIEFFSTNIAKIIPIISPFKIDHAVESSRCVYWNISRTFSTPKYFKILAKVSLSKSENVCFEYLSEKTCFTDTNNSDTLQTLRIDSINNSSVLTVYYCMNGPMVSNISQQFTAFVSLAEKDYGDFRSDFPTAPSENNSVSYFFGLYNNNVGYPENLHVIGKGYYAQPGYQYSFWFVMYDLEAPFDYVRIATSHDFQIMELAPYRTYLAPTGDFYLYFDTDGSVNQAGFVLLVNKFYCTCPTAHITVDCNDSVEKLYYDHKPGSNDDLIASPHTFCDSSSTCKLYITVKPCADSTDLIMINYKITPEYFSLIKSNNNVSLQYSRLLYHYNDGDGFNNSFDLRVQKTYDTIFDSTEVWFVLNIYRKTEPTKYSYNLTLETPYFYFISTNMKNNSYLHVHLDNDAIQKNYTFEVFYSAISKPSASQYDAYSADFGNFITRLDVVDNKYFNMPLSLNMDKDYFIYTEDWDIDDTVLFYGRIRELDTVNCLFKSNVLETTSSFQMTMVNNGTDADCQITLLNVHGSQGAVKLTDFWTSSGNLPVRILAENGDQVYQFTQHNKTDSFQLTDNFYKIMLPPSKSLTMNCNNVLQT